MRTYQDFALRLTGEIPFLDIGLAQLIVQDAGRDIWDAHQWSFLESEGVLYAPASISSGTFSITTGSKTVVADATAIAALSGLVLPVLTKRQIRFGGGSIYNIVDASLLNVTGEITLDRIVREADNLSAQYQVYRCYYGYPEDGDGNEVNDFKAYRSIANPALDYALGCLTKQSEWLDAVDPQRTSFDNPIYLVQYKSSSNLPLWELWPHPTSATTFICKYQSRWTDFSPSSTLPPAVPEQLLMVRSRFYAYQWAEANKGMHVELAKTNWMALAARIDDGEVDNPKGLYYRLLEQAKNKDREMFLDMVVVTNEEISDLNVGDADRIGWYQINYTQE